MKTLNKKLVRDLKLNKMQFITVFLMIFIGVLAFAGVHGYMDGMSFEGEKYYENNNLQDLWLNGENFTKEDLEEVKNIDNVKDAERELTITTKLKNFDDVTLETNFIESNNISKMYVVDGEAFNKDKSGVWLDSYLAKNLNINVGDELEIDYQNYILKEKVLGLINVPDHVYNVKSQEEVFASHKDFGYVYLSINEFPKDYIYDEIKEEILKQNPMLTEDMVYQMISNINVEDYYVFPTIIVDVDDTSKIDETKSNIENTIDDVKLVTKRDTWPSYVSLKSEVDEGKTYSFVFTALFLFIAMLSVVTTMSRFVKKQRGQIGILKALGIKRGTIIRHYVSYGFWISLIASILGVFIGAYTIGTAFLNLENEYFEVPKEFAKVQIIPEVYYLAIAVVIIITIITYLSCRKTLNEPASEAMKMEVPKVKTTHFSTKGIFKNASISTKWNLRDISRNKGRKIMALVGIIGCTMLTVAAFGMRDAMKNFVKYQFVNIDNFDYKIALKEDYTDEELKNIEDKYGDDSSQTLAIEIKKGDTKIAKSLIVNDSEDKLRVVDHNWNPIQMEDDGIYITEKLSKTLGLEIGDEVTWHIIGKDTWYTSKIIGKTRSPEEQQFNSTRKYLESLGIEYSPDSIYTNEDLSNVEHLDGASIIQSKQALSIGVEKMMETMNEMILMLIVLSIILAIVIIYNLGILSLSEKQYQFSTLKVLGFKNKQIQKIYIKQNLWITVVSIIIGIPLGNLMLAYIFKEALGDNYDFGGASVKPLSVILSILIIFIVSLISNKLLAKKVNKIDMVTSLKGNE